MIKVGVIFGGESVEHEVSIISAIQAMNYLDKQKYEAVPIYITKEREMYTGAFLKDIEIYSDIDNLKRYAKNVVLYVKDNRIVLQNKKGLKGIINEIDIALPIVHGTNCEDGTIQGYLDLLGIPYVGSNVYSAAVGQDKVFMKQIFESVGLDIPKYVWFFDDEYLKDSDTIIKKIEKIKYPVIVKPARLGSSVGISRANNKEELTFSIEEAIKYDNKILVEEVIPNLTEVNASVLGDYTYYQVSELEEVIGTDEFLSYEDKYIGNSKGKLKGKNTKISSPSGSKGMLSANRVIPAKIDSKLKEDIVDMTRKAAAALNTSGCARIDYLIDKKKKKAYINEINTIPGSLSFYLWEPIGKSYTELLDEMITLAIKEYKNKSKRTYSFETNILKNFKGLKGSKGKFGKL